MSRVPPSGGTLSFYSSSEKDFLLGTPASCRQLIGSEPFGAGRMPALPGNIYLENYRSNLGDKPA
ncbi:MAG TPA: hypothetical protein PLB18_09790 [Acidobacteriota bacterium]|nr:hypothetical protein [Acidobacteriota bacterium]